MCFWSGCPTSVVPASNSLPDASPQTVEGAAKQGAEPPIGDSAHLLDAGLRMMASRSNFTFEQQASARVARNGAKRKVNAPCYHPG